MYSGDSRVSKARRACEDLAVFKSNIAGDDSDTSVVIPKQTAKPKTMRQNERKLPLTHSPVTLYELRNSVNTDNIHRAWTYLPEEPIVPIPF